jgi:transcriptional regulator with XRE-family HTH domain
MIHEKIKLARKNAALTQKQLGIRMGVTGASIAQYESGERNPKFDTLQRIAAALDVDLSFFVDDELVKYAHHEVDEMIKAVPELINRSKSEMIARTIDFELDVRRDNYLLDAKSEADKYLLELTSPLTEKLLEKRLLDSFKYLNKLGKLNAVLIIDEMESSGNYRRWEQEGETDE